jgi:hypothetical protein
MKLKQQYKKYLQASVHIKFERVKNIIYGTVLSCTV